MKPLTDAILAILVFAAVLSSAAMAETVYFPVVTEIPATKAWDLDAGQWMTPPTPMPGIVMMETGSLDWQAGPLQMASPLSGLATGYPYLQMVDAGSQFGLDKRIIKIVPDEVLSAWIIPVEAMVK